MENNDKTFQLFIKQLGWKWVLIKFEAMILSWIRGGVPNLSWRGVATSSGGTQVAYIGVFSIFEWEIERPIQVAPVERWKLYHLLWWDLIKIRNLYLIQPDLKFSVVSQGFQNTCFTCFWLPGSPRQTIWTWQWAKMKVSFKLFWILCGGSSLVMNWNSSYSSMLLFNSFKLKSTCFSSRTAAWQVRSEAGRILTVSLFCFGVFLAVQTWGFWKCRKIFLGTKEQSLIHWRCSSNYFRGQSKKEYCNGTRLRNLKISAVPKTMQEKNTLNVKSSKQRPDWQASLTEWGWLMFVRHKPFM